MDIRTYRQRKLGWWIEERATVHCILPKDGLVAVFRREDVETLMDKTYPHAYRGQEKVWFFNDSYDREIAETEDDRVVANPQVLWQHFLPKEA